MDTLSAALLLFLVMDPVGNIPVFLALLGPLELRRQRVVLLRELLIALAIMGVFLLGGRCILAGLRISEPALSIAGGVILFLIALRMIFARPQELFVDAPEGEPFIVPLATPLIAGPSAVTTVLLLTAQAPRAWLRWAAALVSAWFASGVILFLASQFSRALGPRGLLAMQRLMGMLLTTVAVQMFLSGLEAFLKRLP